ncbi:aldose 1-epimerase [Phenylobacterium soli]|uniref:Aldose 1-epimerase n=1 Tax=Phenylobacterium soli TaxID=2170551 RepID=A0A328ALU6_9CAUL|nr:aldose 1-epimerase [Phenylobacterium soli]RAK55820.1 aldose 1-epimerase [Phenylobacterium soli]
MTGGATIGGAPVVTLIAGDAPASGPAFLAAEVLPGRGFMLLQASLRLPDGRVVDAIHAPSTAEAARALDGGPEDFAGNAAFSFGGAILLPYANRIRGRALPERREIETQIAGERVRLPRNWGGKRPGAEQYAMHGLILDAAVPFDQPSRDRITGRLAAGDFGGRWPGQAEADFEWSLAGGALLLTVRTRNVGDRPLPLGVGWHPYFALPSGDRRQARLRVPARLRVEVNDYDEVLPTGRLTPVAGGPYDFARPAQLGDLYLDDCFTDLEAAAVEIQDPAAGLGLRIIAPSPHVGAFQIYAPLEQAFVVVEPQFNLADPFGAEWGGRDTGMVRLEPGGTATYEARVEPFALATAAGNP